MKLTAPYIWIMTSGIYDVLQIWDQDGSVSYFDIYANGVKVYTLEKDDDISYVEIEKLDLTTKCEPSRGYNIGVVGYDSNGQCSEDSNVVCWYSDGEFDNNGADPDIIAPFKLKLYITFLLDGMKVHDINIPDKFLSKDGSTPDTVTISASRNSHNNGVTLTLNGSIISTCSYDYKTPIAEEIVVKPTTLVNVTTTGVGVSVSATSSNVTRYKFRRYSRGSDIENSTAKARRYGDFMAPTDCIAFVSDTDDFTLSAYKEWDGTVEYSMDRSTWITWDGSAISSSAQKLYLRGYDNTTFYNSIGSRFSLSAPAKCYGNINTLLQYDEPPTILTDYCYHMLFYGCSNLTQAPELPATTLAVDCYSSMFYCCSNLTKAPELPATTLATYCYQYMFYCCSNLTKAPELPATTLATYCYQYMFNGCTSLTQAPELPATTLAKGCYYSMFNGCTSLTQAPELPATTLAGSCYYRMFYICKKLKLSTTQTDEYTREYRIPTEGTGSTATSALTNMFGSTGGTFTGTPEINTTYYLHSSCSIV